MTLDREMRSALDAVNVDHLGERPRGVRLADEWFAEHLQVGRWPGSGPARHIAIRPEIPVRQVLIMCAMAVFIGVCMAGAL